MGHEIDAWKLIRLWIAEEEFIPTIDECEYTVDFEVKAQAYLEKLVDKNLVMVVKRRADGQIKTCKIHDLLHEFCKREAARKKLFYIIDRRQRLNANILLSRRLCFQTSITDILEAKKNPTGLVFNCYNKNWKPYPSGEHVHSVLPSSSQKSGILHLTQEQLAVIPNMFPFLKVLDIEYLKFRSLPNELYGLHLLKYLAISTGLNLIPKSFNNLRELETLVIKTTKRTLKIGGGIWSMEKLKHVLTNASTQLPPPPSKIFVSTDIRTLSTISPASCTEEILSKTPKLQKLGIRGNLEELLEKKQGVCLFDNLQWLDSLENLKLHGQSEKVLKLPMPDKFPYRLTKLTLSNTLFDWNDIINMLGLLKGLKVLKLDESAFMGELWKLNDDVIFKELKYLRIGRTNLENFGEELSSFRESNSQKLHRP